MERITVTVEPNGAATVSIQGVKGKSCLAATETLEKALGSKTKDTKTGEYYEKEKTTASIGNKH